MLFCLVHYMMNHLSFEVISRLLVMLDDGLHVGHVVLEELSDCLEHGNTGMEDG